MQVQTKTDLVDWDQFDLMLAATGNPEPVVSLFPPEVGSPCIHHRWNPIGPTSKQFIEKNLRQNPKLSLGIVVNPSKPQPSDWGTNPENQKNGRLKTWGAKNEHIASANCVWCEGDAGLSIENQYAVIREAFLLKPSFLIWSGRKSLHPYWRLSEPISPSKFREFQKRLAAQMKSYSKDFGVDETLHNPCRVMRAAGGLHAKTQERCHFKNVSNTNYGVEFFESFLDPLQEKTHLPKPISKKIFSSVEYEGWFTRRTPADQHRLAVEMVSCLPLRNEEGRGEYKTNISALYSLKGHFGETEAAAICEEANWFGTFWDPIERLPSVQNPTNSIGTLICLARENGWQLKEEAPQESPSKIQLENIFPPEITKPLRVVTKYLPYPDSLIASTYLASCSGLMRLGSSINVNPLSDFLVPLNLFVITVGATGSKKTPLHKALIDNPIEELKAEAKREFQEELKAWLKTPEEEQGEKPKHSYLMVKNITEESLEGVLQDLEKKRLGLLYSRDEIAGIFGGLGQYKKGKGSEKEQLLELYDGSGFCTIRQKGERSSERTHLSIYGGIQPQTLAQLQASQDFTGAWARCLFSPLPANPSKLAVRITQQEVEAFKEAKEKLQYFAKRIRQKSGSQYLLSPEGIEIFAEFEYRKSCEAVSSNRPSHAAILNKSAGKVARITGILHLLNGLTKGEKTSPIDEVVNAELIEPAVQLVEYLDRYAMKFQNETSRSEKEKWMRRFHTLTSKSKSKKMTWSELRAKLSGKERTSLSPEMRQQVFEQLVEGNFGRLTKGPQGGLVYEALCDWPDDV